MKRLIIGCLIVLLAQPALAAEKIEKQAAMREGTTLRVVNVAGSVTVSGWRKKEVEVIAELGDEAERLIFESDSDGVLVEVEQNQRDDQDYRKHDYRSNGSHLVIRVPFSTHLKVNAVSADVNVTDIRGDQHVRSVSGDIRASMEGDEIVLRSVSGDIQATGNGKGREFTLYSVSGNVTATALAGEIEAEAVSGDLVISGTGISRLRLKTVSGDIEAQLGLADDSRVRFESVSGDVEARLPAGYAADYELTSHSGDIAGMFGQNAVRKSKYGPGSELMMTRGGGKARVRANTLSGDITLVPDM